MKQDIFKLIWSYDGMKQIIAQIIDNDHNLMKYEKNHCSVCVKKLVFRLIFF